jgi:hypothetical protein
LHFTKRAIHRYVIIKPFSTMADKEDSLVSSVPSLRKLCEQKALKHLLGSDNPEREFAALEPRVQELLFSSLRKENDRLSEAEKKWRLLTTYCPRIDTQIYMGSTRIPPDDGEDEENSYHLRDTFFDQWSYVNEDGHGNGNTGEEVAARRNEALRSTIGAVGANQGGSGPETVCDTSWNGMNLFSESLDSDLKLCFHDRLNRCPCFSDRTLLFLSRLVSSQLLLYRITATFGMPPPSEDDGYKTCWAVELLNHDRVSVLSFQDYKGAADVRFYGTADASVDALKLLSYLAGMKCVHTYDGIIAGTAA